MSAVAQPSGTVTLVFTDIEGSTKLLDELGVEAYRQALGEHRRIVRAACARHAGYEVDAEGDAFFYAFATPQAAVTAMSETMQGLDGGPIRIRVGIHTGEPALDPPNYIGIDIHRAARIMASGHGGQVVLSPTTVALLEGGSFVIKQLGEHRLKDLSVPIQLYQLQLDGLPDSFPPLKTLFHSNLPVPATPFLGREREVAEVVGRLTDPATRLLTLTGPGGTGKTRLALQAAAAAADHYPDGITWVPLAPLRDPEFVAPMIAQALGVEEQPGWIWESVAEALLGKRALLVLDNAEHLLPDLARALAEFTAESPTVRIFVTSRERLQVAAETTWPVPPMTATDATGLFLARSTAVGSALQSEDESVAELCRRLDSLPLAIELAAARSVVFTPRQLLERLGERLDLLRGERDRDPRQQTLRATIAWSHDLLGSDEQRVLRRLSVFAAGAGYAAAEHVADADPETLQSLLDKSLLRRRDAPGEPRYWLLETIRQYAAEQLENQGETAVTRDRHLDWILEHVRANAPEYVRPADPARVEALVAEEEDILVALSWAVTKPDADRALELCGRMGRAWIETGRWKSGRSASLPALSLGGGRPELVAGALLTAGLLGWHAGVPQADEQVRAARDTFNDLGRRWEAAVAGMFFGSRLAESGDADAGIALLERSVEEFTSLGDQEGTRVARGSLADAAAQRAVTDQELRRAAALIEETLELDRAAGDKYDELAGLGSLAEVLLRLEEPADARATALRAAGIARAIGSHRMLAHLTVCLADASSAGGRHEEGLLLAAAVEPISRELGRPLTPRDHNRVEKARGTAEQLLGESARASAVERGSAMTAEGLLDYLATLDAASA